VGTRRASKRKGNKVWTVVLIDQVITDSTSGFDIVEDVDWVSGTASRRATIKSIVGYLNFVSLLAAQTEIRGYVGVTDENAATAAPSAVTTYSNEDIMWTLGWASMNEVTAGFDGNQHQEISIQHSMRKIRSGQDCRLALETDIANAYHCSGLLRALLILD